MDKHERVRGLKGSYEWLSLAASLPAKPLPFNLSATTRTLYTGSCILTGLYVNNGSGANNNFAVYAGQDNSAAPIYQSFLTSGGNANNNFGTLGVLCENGITVTVTGNTWTGNLYIIDLWNYEWTPPGE